MDKITAPVVLMYHSISEGRGPADVFNLHVSPNKFREQIEALASAYGVLSLAELGHDLREGRLRPNSVVITFDDGYANNLSVAAPILQEFHLPATLFICTGFLGRQTFWWDKLIETVFTATRFPERLAGVEPGLGDAEVHLNEYLRHRDPATLKKIVLKMWCVLVLLGLDRIYLILAELEELFKPMSRLDDLRPLRAEEVGAAAAYFDIGAHSATHPLMSTLDERGLISEVVTSKKKCEALTARPVECFAYPSGDLDIRVVQEVSRHMSLACTSRRASVVLRTDPFEIPRIPVRNCSASQLGETIRDVVRGRGKLDPLRLAARAVMQPRKAAARLIDMTWPVGKKTS